MFDGRTFREIFGRIKYDPSKDRFPLDPWPVNTPKEEWFIEADDHIRLGGWFYPADSDICVIYAHGYHNDITTQGAIPRVLHDVNGWNVLMISQRGTGISEGDYGTLGILERYDIVCWAREIKKRAPQMKVVLHGVSMGANAVLGALGEELPDNVICAVADSSFTRTDRQILETMKHRHSFLPFGNSIINSLDDYCRKEYDFSIRHNVEEALQLNHLPTLFIHGGRDKVVPLREVRKCYTANAGPKQLLISDRSGHCEAFFKDQDDYMLAYRAMVLKAAAK